MVEGTWEHDRLLTTRSRRRHLLLVPRRSRGHGRRYRSPNAPRGLPDLPEAARPSVPQDQLRRPDLDRPAPGLATAGVSLHQPLAGPGRRRGRVRRQPRHPDPYGRTPPTSTAWSSPAAAPARATRPCTRPAAAPSSLPRSWSSTTSRQRPRGCGATGSASTWLTRPRRAATASRSTTVRPRSWSVRKAGVVARRGIDAGVRRGVDPDARSGGFAERRAVGRHPAVRGAGSEGGVVNGPGRMARQPSRRSLLCRSIQARSSPRPIRGSSWRDSGDSSPAWRPPSTPGRGSRSRIAGERLQLLFDTDGLTVAPHLWISVDEQEPELHLLEQPVIELSRRDGRHTGRGRGEGRQRARQPVEPAVRMRGRVRRSRARRSSQPSAAERPAGRSADRVLRRLDHAGRPRR